MQKKIIELNGLHYDTGRITTIRKLTSPSDGNHYIEIRLVGSLDPIVHKYEALKEADDFRKDWETVYEAFAGKRYQWNNNAIVKANIVLAK